MDDQVTSDALRAIRRILRAAEQGTRRLAVATGLTPSQLLVLQEIESRGERDRRQVLLAVTDAGRVALEAAPDLLQQRFRTDFAALPAWERAMILAALERLGELLDASEIDAAPLIDAGAIDRSAR